VDEHQHEPNIEELRARGLYDPADPGAADRLELLRYVLARGATVEQVAASRSLGDLALDLSLRAGPWIELGEVVASSGLEWDDAVRLLTALGFPTYAEDLVTEEEAAAIRLLGAASTRLLGPEATVQIARVAGSAIARIADALVGAFRLRFELPRLQTGSAYSEVVKEYSTLTEEVLPGFVQTLDALLRRQLVAVADRVWSTDAEHSAVTLARTVGFADLVGYTAASATMSVGELAGVLSEFDERVTGIVHRGNGQLVKTLGDEAMFACESADDACRIALRLVDEFSSGRLPPVRVGLAAGNVLSAFGDIYGPDVNLAARLVGAADASAVVVSTSVQAESAETFRFEPVGPLTLKGFMEPVAAYRLLGPAPAPEASAPPP
jgi:adenylate cyclase